MQTRESNTGNVSRLGLGIQSRAASSRRSYGYTQDVLTRPTGIPPNTVFCQWNRRHSNFAPYTYCGGDSVAVTVRHGAYVGIGVHMLPAAVYLAIDMVDGDKLTASNVPSGGFEVAICYLAKESKKYGCWHWSSHSLSSESPASDKWHK